MNITLIINLILWVPFAIAFLVAGIILGISGCKKGVVRAAISLAVTVIAAGLALLGARLLSPLAASPLADKIVSLMASEGDVPVELMKAIITGALISVISLLIFALLLLIFTIVLNLVSRKIKTAEKTTTPLRLAGLGVALVNAAVFALLFMLPLYGTLATYVPVVDSVYNLVGDGTGAEEEITLALPTVPERSYIITADTAPSVETEEVVLGEVISTISSHPMLAISGSAPLAVTYEAITTFELEGGSLSLAEIASTTDELMNRVISLVEKWESGDVGIGEMERDFVDFLEKKVVRTDWIYALYSEYALIAEEMLPEDMPAEYADQVDTFLNLSREEFDATTASVISFVSEALECGVPEVVVALQNGEEYLDKLDLKRLSMAAGELLNASDTVVYIKNSVIYESIRSSGLDDASVKKITESLTYGIRENEAERLAEGEAYVILICSGSEYGAIEGIARHPDIGVDLAREIFMASMDTEDEEYDPAVDGVIVDAIFECLEECVEMEVGRGGFGDCAEALEAISSPEESGYTDCNYNENSVSFALEVLSPDYFAAMALASERPTAAWVEYYSLMSLFVEKDLEIGRWERGAGTFAKDMFELAKLITAAKTGVIYPAEPIESSVSVALYEIASSDSVNIFLEAVDAKDLKLEGELNETALRFIAENLSEFDAEKNENVIPLKKLFGIK